MTHYVESICTQINLEHASGEANNADQDRGPWEVDLEQTSKICKGTEIVLLAASVAAPPSKAGPNYEFIPGMGYYKLHTTTKTWLEARNTCAEEGAHLAIINSEKELRALQGIFQLYPKIRDGWENNVAYIGFHDLFTEGQYVTIF
ncbi:unnamed protein product, partial [Timema podura]|nr:unnamed protein product [Timema podura]